MSRAGRLTRRVFLVAGAAAAGGVAFGVYTKRRELPNPLAPEDGSALSPWLIFRESGVEVVIDRAEMGQGVATTLAALVAEELGLPWEEVRIRFAPAAQVYFNAVLVHDALPFSGREARWLIDAAESAAEVLPKALGWQITGGSTAARDGFDKLRLAGATAREALRAAAVARFGVDPALLVQEGAAFRTPDGARILFADLAPEAAQHLPETVALKPRAEWQLLGKALPRIDMRDKVTGRATYGIDVRLPGMRFATLRQPPVLGGRLTAHDAEAARAVPGVTDVRVIGDTLYVTATNTWAALQGAEAAAPEWASEAPDHAALRAGLESAFTGWRNSKLTRGSLPEQGTEVAYSLPWLAHATMEPMNATALVEGERLTIWAPTQVPMRVKTTAARAAGVSEANTEVHSTFLGGGFGRRLETDYADHAARLAAAQPGTPVQLVWSREEDMAQDVFRPATLARARFTSGSATGEGATLDLSIAAQSLSATATRRMTGLPAAGPDKLITDGGQTLPYAFAGYRLSGYKAELPVPVGFWRSVGHSTTGFIVESIVDEMAHAAGADPLAYRRALCAADPSATALLDAVARLSGWGRPPPGRAQGVALFNSFGTGVAQVVEVERRGDSIALTRAFIAVDPGLALDPGIIRQQMEGGLIFGLSAAIHGETSFPGGAAEQLNFGDLTMLRIGSVPSIETEVLEIREKMGGIGEPGVPPAAAALANAVFALTGQRHRDLPLSKALRFA